MAQDRYEVRVTGNYFNYEFTSSGPNGLIKKAVEFTLLPTATDVQIFNLAFGDSNEATQRIDDIAVSNNKDTLKVIATVAHIVSDFTEHHPDAVIYATGSSEARNRLYQMAINKYWKEINKMYDVHGQMANGIWIEFTSGINFSAFVAKRKNINFIIQNLTYEA